jgi:hypothetical protein
MYKGWEHTDVPGSSQRNQAATSLWSCMHQYPIQCRYCNPVPVPAEFMQPSFFYVFYVLLTVHLGIILVNDQFDTQFFFLMCLFQFSMCFEQPCAHHQENQLYQYNIWCMSLCVGGRLVRRSGSSFPTCTLI